MEYRLYSYIFVYVYFLFVLIFQVHPQGASLDYVVSYVRALFPTISQATIHHVLQKHDEVFAKTTSGVGANIENRWTFVAFNSNIVKSKSE